MATYSTIAADVEAEQPLVNNAPKRSVKLLIGGAAVAAFVLGALAATAVTSSPGLRGADFSSSSGDLVQIADAKYNYNCMAVHGEAKEGAKIVVEPCSNGGPYQTVWKSTSASGAPDNSSLSHFSAMTWSCWPQAARRWRGG